LIGGGVAANFGRHDSPSAIIETIDAEIEPEHGLFGGHGNVEPAGVEMAVGRLRAAGVVLP